VLPVTVRELAVAGGEAAREADEAAAVGADGVAVGRRRVAAAAAARIVATAHGVVMVEWSVRDRDHTMPGQASAVGRVESVAL
jgi:hypothetical protein